VSGRQHTFIARRYACFFAYARRASYDMPHDMMRRAMLTRRAAALRHMSLSPAAFRAASACCFFSHHADDDVAACRMGISSMPFRRRLAGSFSFSMQQCLPLIPYAADAAAMFFLTLVFLRRVTLIYATLLLSAGMRATLLLRNILIRCRAAHASLCRHIVEKEFIVLRHERVTCYAS